MCFFINKAFGIQFAISNLVFTIKTQEVYDAHHIIKTDNEGGQDEKIIGAGNHSGSNHVLCRSYGSRLDRQQQYYCPGQRYQHMQGDEHKQC